MISQRRGLRYTVRYLRDGVGSENRGILCAKVSEKVDNVYASRMKSVIFRVIRCYLWWPN